MKRVVRAGDTARGLGGSTRDRSIWLGRRRPCGALIGTRGAEVRGGDGGAVALSLPTARPQPLSISSVVHA